MANLRELVRRVQANIDKTLVEGKPTIPAEVTTRATKLRSDMETLEKELRAFLPKIKKVADSVEKQHEALFACIERTIPDDPDADPDVEPDTRVQEHYENMELPDTSEVYDGMKDLLDTYKEALKEFKVMT